MDEFYFRKSHVPAFGSWYCDDDLPFTQCFETARGAGLFRCSYSDDQDLYFPGDLYENDVVAPAMIVVPPRRAKARYPKEAEGKKDAWVLCDLKATPSPPRTKAVDEDLYKISPELLRAQSKRKKSWGFFSRCLKPTYVC